MTVESVSPIRPGDGLLHPVALGALAILVLNDQLLKAAWPGIVTGKLSDVAGLIVAPLVVVAAWEIAVWAAGSWTGPGRTALVVAIAVVAIGFTTSQVWSPAGDVYRLALGVLQWPFAVIGALVGGTATPPLRPVDAVADGEDLIALPALAITWWVGTRRVIQGDGLVASGRASGGRP